MKRVISLICVSITLLTAAGCIRLESTDTDVADTRDRIIDDEEITNMDTDEDDTDNADTYNTEPITELKTSNSEYTISFELNEDKINVSGRLNNNLHNYLLVVFNKNNDGENNIKVKRGAFEGEFDIPNKNETLVELYAGEEEYGTFESIILDYVVIEKQNGEWCFAKSPVYEKNAALFGKKKDKSECLNATKRIQSDDKELIRLAEDITEGIDDEYEKVRAVHDWVAENIYYDFDALASGNYDNLDAKNVLKTKKGVCEGYANLMAALLRSVDIPCRVQNGYALGIGTDKEWNSSNTNTSESNHAWNEVYADGRWIIIDATWDSQNKYKDGKYITGNFITEVYFDSTLEFFSLSHKLIADRA